MIDVDQHCVQVSQISFVNGSSKLCIIIQSVMDTKKLMLLVQKSMTAYLDMLPILR